MNANDTIAELSPLDEAKMAADSALTDVKYALKQLANAIDGERLGWNRRQERDALIRCKDALERVLEALASS